MNELAGQRLGDFEVVRELGRGGMGVVYEARQVSLNRRVALKVLAPGLALTPKAVERFRREAEAAAKLHHTNIVPVYATGTERGYHFYAMELIDGPSLDRVIQHLRATRDTKPRALGVLTLPAELTATGPYFQLTPLTPTGAGGTGPSSGSGYFDTAARMVADVADALNHAHANNVIHRDIKPSNLLLGADGRLSVNDFGLARALEEPGMTTTGEFVGTPAYTSPEQITAGRIPIDHRADIYSLGATLYELLTLRPPFTADRRDQLLALVVQKEPSRPHTLNPLVPRDLETICLKCLEKDPDRRYQSAQDVADDLRRYVNRFAIRAKRTGPLGRMRKWAKRNPGLAAALSGALVLASAAGYFAWHAHHRQQQLLVESQKHDDEVRVERQRAAIDRGMIAAMAADLTTARRAVEEAEQLGAPEADVRLLCGFVELYAGQARVAIGQFTGATDLQPRSVAAHSLLSIAYGQVSDWSASERAFKEAERLVPTTAEDRLFLGMALTPYDAGAATRELRVALEQRPSNFGRVLLAEALVIHAANTGLVPDAETALDAAETAVRLLPGITPVEANRVTAHLTLATAHRLHGGNAATVTTHLELAEKLANSLSGPAGSLPVWTSRCNVAGHRDDLAAPQRLTRQLRFAERLDDPDLAYLKAMTLWRLGHIEQARATVTAVPLGRPTFEVTVGLQLEEPGGRAAAHRIWDAYEGAGTDDYALAVVKIPWLYAIGESNRVLPLARRVRESGYRFRAASPTDWDAVLRYWEGALTDAEFLAAPAANRPQLAWRHFLVGMKRLGAGDREGAREAFTACYDMRVFAYDPWTWSQTFLIRMNQDPEWPRAIPMRGPSPREAKKP